MFYGCWIFALFLTFLPLFQAQDDDSECHDLNSNCAGMKEYCNRTHYFLLMTEKCALTCGRCDYVIPSAYYSPSCRDNINIDCGKYVDYCTKKRYIPLMTKHCPFTCRICNEGKPNQEEK